MSIELFENVVCIDVETKQKMNHHSILVGVTCEYCMNCGKILIEYKNKNDFKRLMNPFKDDF
jgi:hypothetical protein